MHFLTSGTKIHEFFFIERLSFFKKKCIFVGTNFLKLDKMKKLFLVLGLAVVLLASCCNNNNQKGTQKCDGQKVEACQGHNHDGAACEKKCEGQKPEACKGDHQNCEKKCEGQKPEACQGHNHEAQQGHQHQHEGCNHQHGSAK